VPGWVYGDETRLRQVLVNLLGNAIKFTERGEVVVSVSSRIMADERYEIKFAVRDTGIGIPREARDKLFKSFSQVNARVSRRSTLRRRASTAARGLAWRSASAWPN